MNCSPPSRNFHDSQLQKYLENDSRSQVLKVFLRLSELVVIFGIDHKLSEPFTRQNKENKSYKVIPNWGTSW